MSGNLLASLFCFQLTYSIAARKELTLKFRGKVEISANFGRVLTLCANFSSNFLFFMVF
jgi:hypothetical protein